jgi:AcrR family transcriptional regulator
VFVEDSDLTAPARIRNAALRLFAENGVDGTSIRDIAGAAGVSPGLVQHHFKTKDAVRDAVNGYVLLPVGHVANATLRAAAQVLGLPSRWVRRRS